MRCAARRGACPARVDVRRPLSILAHSDDSSSLLTRAVVLSLAIAAPLSAVAHPRLLASLPDTNGRVKTVPASVRLTFQERLEPAINRISMVPAGTHSVTIGPITVDTTDNKTPVAAMKTPMGDDAYVAAWQAAVRDGHPMRGTFTFTVDASAPR